MPEVPDNSPHTDRQRKADRMNESKRLQLAVEAARADAYAAAKAYADKADADKTYADAKSFTAAVAALNAAKAALAANKVANDVLEALANNKATDARRKAAVSLTA